MKYSDIDGKFIRANITSDSALPPEGLFEQYINQGMA